MQWSALCLAVQYRMKMKQHLIVFAFISFRFLQNCGVFSLTCQEVLVADSGVTFNVEELTTLNQLTKDDLQTCLSCLGKDKLRPQQAHAIWSAIVEVFGSIEEIPETTLRELSWIMVGISPSHFYNMSLSEPDTIMAFGKYKGLSFDQLNALKESILDQWSEKRLEDMTSYDLAMLGHIVCAFNTSEVSLIHADSYRDAANELNTLKHCPLEVLTALAGLAISTEAFGDPRTWTPSQVSAVGCVMSGLTTIAVIPAEAMEGLTLESVSCLPHKVLKDMTAEQLSMLSPMVALSLTEDQKSVFSKEQLASLLLAIEGESNGSLHSVTLTLILYFVSLVLCYGTSA